MQCYDCLVDDHVTTAVAVCSSCGAALCEEHVRAEHREIRQLVGVGRATHEPSARRLVCGVCYRAESPPSASET